MEMVELPSHPLDATVIAAADTTTVPESWLDPAITMFPDPDLVNVVAPDNWIGFDIVSTEEDCDTRTEGLVPPKVNIPPPIPKFAFPLVRFKPLAQTPEFVMKRLLVVFVRTAVFVNPFVELHGVWFVVFHPLFVPSQPNEAFVLVMLAPGAT